MAESAPPEGLAYRGLGAVRLRNVATPVTLFEVVTTRPVDDRVVIDPVCRMRVTVDEAPARLPFAGRAYYFCSLECARLFAERPGDYATELGT